MANLLPYAIVAGIAVVFFVVCYILFSGGSSEKEEKKGKNRHSRAVSERPGQGKSSLGYDEAEKRRSAQPQQPVREDTAPIPRISNVTVRERQENPDETAFVTTKGEAIAIGVAIILCGVTIPILFDEEVGAAFFLLMVGIAVAVFVAFGIRDAHRWQYLDERKIYVSRSDVETLKKAYQKFQKRFMVVITSGIFLIIFGLCATVAADALIHDAAERYGAILFYFTAAAMLLIIPAGIMNGAYRRFIYFEAANQEKDKEKQASRYAFIWGITMPLAAMVFLFIGLTQESWEIVWIIFPIVAILTAGLINILEYRNSRREEK